MPLQAVQTLSQSSLPIEHLPLFKPVAQQGQVTAHPLSGKSKLIHFDRP